MQEVMKKNMLINENLILCLQNNTDMNWWIGSTPVSIWSLNCASLLDDQLWVSEVLKSNCRHNFNLRIIYYWTDQKDNQQWLLWSELHGDQSKNFKTDLVCKVNPGRLLISHISEESCFTPMHLVMILSRVIILIRHFFKITFTADQAIAWSEGHSQM